jgi:hypothetical protein
VQKAPTGGERLSCGTAVAGSEVRPDEEPMRTLSKWIDANSLRGISCR